MNRGDGLVEDTVHARAPENLGRAVGVGLGGEATHENIGGGTANDCVRITG